MAEGIERPDIGSTGVDEARLEVVRSMFPVLNALSQLGMSLRKGLSNAEGGLPVGSIGTYFDAADRLKQAIISLADTNGDPGLLDLVEERRFGRGTMEDWKAIGRGGTDTETEEQLVAGLKREGSAVNLQAEMWREWHEPSVNRQEPISIAVLDSNVVPRQKDDFFGSD